MPACHAGGHEFEPRTHRKGPSEYLYVSVGIFISTNNTITKTVTIMKKTILFIIIFLSFQSLYGQERTTKLTVYPEFKPSTITLSNGGHITLKFTNVFLKNSSLLYMSGSTAKEANMDNILSVQFDDRLYLKIDSLLAYQVDSVGKDGLFCATIIDQVAYIQNLKNNQVLTNIDLQNFDQISTTSVDLNNEEDLLFPLINIYYYRLGGKFVRCHDRSLNNILDKEKKRILRTFVHLDDFSWSDEQSLINLLKRLQ